MPKQFQIIPYPFDSQLEFTLAHQQRDYLSWPIVYFLQNTQEAYVGETTDMVTRMKAHLKTENKQQLKSVSLILSDLFNKSATLDLESNLIRYIAADGQFDLLNGNLGLSDHKFYQQKEIYWELFRDIWSELRTLGIARHSLEYIDNSDLFKYSPYKTLSREQTNGLKMILNCLLDDQAKVSLIHGGAGTGKSILAIFLFKLLKTDLKDFNRADFDESDEELFELVEAVRHKYGQLDIGLVIPMQSFRKTISKVFKNIKGLSPKMVIGPAEVAKRKYDLLIVDEGHRLRQWKNLAAYYGTFRKVSQQLGFDELTCSELDWIEQQADRSIIFYDEFQSIKPSDVNAQRFIDLQLKSSTRIERLRSQFRVRGGAPYMDLIHEIFKDGAAMPAKLFESVRYDFKLFDDLDEMVATIKSKNEQEGLCRMVAGFAWEWISKNDRTLNDIVIGESQLQWNSTDVDWVNSPNAINEVGCIHTTQGYDLNYTGLIIGPELDYDFTTKSFVIYKDRYKDKNGKNSISDPKVLKNYILNIYRTILFRGIRGTYVYVCNDNLRAYLSQFIKQQQKQGAEQEDGVLISVVPCAHSVPFYDLAVAAGNFSELQQSETLQYIDVEERYQDPQRYFACKVVGESMNKIIPNGSICLFERYQGGSRNGLICLVESSSFEDRDFGANYTIKEYSSKKTITDEGWQHQEIILLPKSTDDSYSPIILKDEETVDLQVIGVFRKVL
ncbi:DNA/RNA helicase domain-containing protein [Sphingobacterium sp.]|uniref:DNA/RNA helicase domain-containing protein n=1 Tax=Sphingobacterium sp. TaxID=341027 RepID=UPI002896E455|nr:DNA/RNA helicase domain-containing protein [Sphingobacterium sp.]